MLIKAEEAQPNENSPALSCLLPENSTLCFHSASINLSLYLQMLDKHFPAYSGNIRYIKPLNTAYINHEIQLVSWLSGFANLTLAANYHQQGSRQEITERAYYLLNYFSCNSIHSSLPNFISPLEKKYFLIARALMLEPQVVFLDKPFIGLNKQEAEKLREKLIPLANEFKLTLITNETGLDFIQRAQAQIIHYDAQKFHQFSHWKPFQHYLKRHEK